MVDIIKQVDNLILKYKDGIQVAITTPVTTTRGTYEAKRYKKIPIEQLVTKSTEEFSLIGSYKSGEHSAEVKSDNDIHQVFVNGNKIYESDNLGDALNRYYHELKNISLSQTEDRDLALSVFGDMVVEQNRKILPMLNQLGRLSEAKIAKQWAQFGVVPFNEEKDTDTVVSRAIPAKEFNKKRLIRSEQQPIIGGNVSKPGIADFGMQSDVRKNIDNIIQKYEAGKEADKHKYVKKIEADEEAPEGTYAVESKGHTYAYPKEEWGVEPKETTVSQDKPVINKIANSFSNKGFELYEVGGRVRDSLLGRESHDIDMTTNATPDETQAILEELNIGSIYDIGKKFGTIGVMPKEGDSIEITTYRGETYTPGSRKPSVSFGGKLSLKDDLSRRDFTINSLARGMDGKIIDYFGGQEDLKNKVIRAVGNAADRFADDPLRMLRAARFAAQLGFSVDTEMPEPEQLDNISKERISAELDKILLSKNPGRGFDVMDEFGLTKYVIPELDSLVGVHQLPHHANDVYEHVMEVVSNANKFDLPKEDKHILMLAALLHDIAKPTTRTEAEGKAHFYEHENMGAEKAKEILTNLKYSNDIIDKVTTLIKHHMYILHTLNSADVSDKQLRRFVFSVGAENVPLLIALAKSDAKSSTRTDTSFIDKLEERVKNMPEENKNITTSPLDGNEIMSKFNIKPGRIITAIKNYLINKVVDGELVPDDKEAAYELATKFMDENKNMITKSLDTDILNDTYDENEGEEVEEPSDTVTFDTEDIINEDGTVTTITTTKEATPKSETINFKHKEIIDDNTTKISPYQSAAEDGESIVNNESGVFAKQMKPSSFGPPTLTPGWIPGRQTVGKIPVRVPIKRQGKIYYGIRWKRPGEGGVKYPTLKPQGHLVRPEDYLEDSLVHSTLYFGTDKDTANKIFKYGFRTGISGRFGLAFYLYTNIAKAKIHGDTIVMAKLNTEEVFVVAHPNSDEIPVRYADFITHSLRKNLGDPVKNTEVAIEWNDEFLKRGLKALAYPMNMEKTNNKEYELELIVFTSDILKVVANVRKDGGKEDIKKDMGEDIPNPDYNNMPKYTYGTSGIPDATVMNVAKQATFSTKEQIPAEIGNNSYPIKHPIGPNLDNQKPILEK